MRIYMHHTVSLPPSSLPTHTHVYFRCSFLPVYTIRTLYVQYYITWFEYLIYSVSIDTACIPFKVRKQLLQNFEGNWTMTICFWMYIKMCFHSGSSHGSIAMGRFIKRPLHAYSGPKTV